MEKDRVQKHVEIEKREEGKESVREFLNSSITGNPIH